MKKVLFLFTALCFLTSCDPEKSSDNPVDTDGFNRKALLEHTADNIIIPAYQDLSIDLSLLETSVSQFTTTPNVSNLQNARNSFFTAYKTWQYVEMFNIGKADEINYAFQMNIYPTNVSDIQSNINAGSYDLTSPNNNDAVGFPAVEYLLYGMAGTDSETITMFTTDPKAAATKSYLNALVSQMQQLTNTVLLDWTNSYRNTFVNSTGNTATSSVNLLVNDYIFYFEKGLRANKIGIPAGVFSATPLESKVESFHNPEKSGELATLGLQASVDFFNGKGYNSSLTGSSIASYVQFLRDNTASADLAAAINAQLTAAQNQMNVLNSNFQAQITTDNTKMTMTYDQLQRVVVLLKVDLLQTLNINVDYADADGD